VGEGEETLPGGSPAAGGAGLGRVQSDAEPSAGPCVCKG